MYGRLEYRVVGDNLTGVRGLRGLNESEVAGKGIPARPDKTRAVGVRRAREVSAIFARQKRSGRPEVESKKFPMREDVGRDRRRGRLKGGKNGEKEVLTQPGKK